MNKKVWYCTECNRILEDDEIVTQREMVGEYWGSPAYEDREVSACCGEAFDEGYLCARCGEHLANADDELCSHCRFEIASKLVKLIEKNFTSREIKAICDMVTYDEIQFVGDYIYVEVEDDE